MSVPEPLTHSVDIDLVGVAKLKSVSPEPSDQGVINGETTILRFRVQDGERITLDTGRRAIVVTVNPSAGATYPGLWPTEPVVARDEAAELRAALAEMSDLVFTMLSAEDELSRAKGPGGSYHEDVAGYHAARRNAWEELCSLAREHDDPDALRAALAASEGQP